MMGCKSGLYGANTASQTVAAGGTVNLGGVVRNYGSNLSMTGGNVIATGCGFYSGDVNLSFTGQAGTTEIVVLQNGVAIPGANATLTTAATTEYAVNVPFMIRNYCNVPSTITVQVNGTGVTVDNAAVKVVKI